MSEKYYSLSQLKSIVHIETNQWNGYSEVCDLYDLKKLRPADVRPVVLGRWELAEDGWYCTACKLYPPFDCDPEEKGVLFCPWCGAYMRGESDG